MTLIHLIRHGKAALGQDNYDELRPLGITQSEHLGRYLQTRGTHYDAVYCGPLVRQRDTLRSVREAAGELGASWPEAQVLDGLAEAPYDHLIRQAIGPRLSQDAHLRQLVAAMQDAGGDKQRLSPLIRQVFEHMAILWHQGEIAVEGLESGDQFDARVLTALERIQSQQQEAGVVAVVTSNGVIARIVRHLKGQVVDASYRFLPVANTSITTLHMEGTKLHLGAVDETAHLDDPGLITLL